MKREDSFVVNGKIDVNLVKPELAKIMAMVEAMLILMREELFETITCSHQLWFFQAILNHLQITMELYRHVYSVIGETENNKASSSLNKVIEKDSMADELSSSIHQLHSLCYLASYKILDELDPHVVNGLTVVNKHLQRATHLIDILAMQQL